MSTDPVIRYVSKLEARAWAFVRLAVPCLLLAALVAVPIRCYLDPAWGREIRRATLPAGLSIGAVAGAHYTGRLISSTRRRGP